MKIFKFILAIFFSVIAFSTKANVTGDKGNDNDSTANLKSNIVIFKMITSPVTAPSSGSLKKAGKVARTSNSHPSAKSAPPVSTEG